MLKVTFVGLFVLSVIPFVVHGNLTCFSCRNIARSHSCNNTVQCQHGEKCMITRTLMADGTSSYNMGCASRDTCHSLTGSHSAIGKRAASPGVKCKSCCDTPECNYQCCHNNSTLEACCNHHHGYTYIPETKMCIKLYTTLSSWQEAQKTCIGDHTNLLIVRNHHEFHAVAKHIGDALSNVPAVGTCHTHNVVWTGGNDIEQKGIYQWENGGHNFTHWQTSQLHANGGSCDHVDKSADCVVINLKSGVWNDRHCDYKLPFVCQKT